MTNFDFKHSSGLFDLDESISNYREVPIDCFPEDFSVCKETEPVAVVARQPISPLADESILDEQLVYNDQTNQKKLARNSSLSTIAEEKTLCSSNQPTPGANVTVKGPTSVHHNYNAFIVQSFLGDLDGQKELINEIKNVFTTRDGELSRNIAIRFKSSSVSAENVNYDSSGVAGSVTSTASPVKSFCFDESQLLLTMSNRNRLNVDKYRFAKHLKNCIENRRGRPISSGSISRTTTPELVNSPKSRLKRNNFFVRQKNFSKRLLENDKLKV